MKRTFLTCIVSFGALLFSVQFVLSAETVPKQLGLPIKTIMIDPWYGGKEKGPRIRQRYGKDISLEIAEKLRNLLKPGGFEVHLTRSGDQAVPLEDRLFQAKSKGGDIHIAIKLSRAKEKCIHIYMASPTFKKNVDVAETRKLEDLDTVLGEILNNLTAQSIHNDSLTLAGTISKGLMDASVSDCVELRRSKEYFFANAQLPTIMVDIRGPSTGKQSEIFDDNSLDDIVRLLAKSIKQYADDRRPKAGDF